MLKLIRIVGIFALLFGGLAAVALPELGEWDGVTPSAKLEWPYEDPRQANVPFGIISYFNMPWRAYMDTWTAQKYLEVPAAQWNLTAKYAEPLCQLLAETGIITVRYELGWGNLDWNDQLPAKRKEQLQQIMPIFKKYGIRPLILLNGHHGMPCPVRDVKVELLEAAKKGDHSIKVKDSTDIRVGYTGMRHPKYIVAYPLITAIDDDGTLHLSAALTADIPAGRYSLQELKYQPFQGTVLKDGTPVPAAQETYDGWKKYVATVADAVREALGTKDLPDAGFDMEVWNEYTFGSNFLNINNYYEEKPQYSEQFIYRYTRPRQPGFRPDAKINFESKGVEAILPITVDYIKDPLNAFPGVNVISGFANQRPWENGTDCWAGQAGFSRHYYTGGWQDCSPEHPLSRLNIGTMDALGNFGGKKDGKDWHTIEPGTNFIPTFRLAMPEYFHTGFKSEMLTRDLIPDSRLAYMKNHGRYTHNGDFQPAQVWMSEVNYYRRPFFDALIKANGITIDDPRLPALDEHLAGKMLLRQYIFHGHKGIYRMIIFCLNKDPLGFGMLPPSFYKALDENNLQLNEQVRAEIPPVFTGLKWLREAMVKGEKIEAPRPLRVDELIEYKPRFAMAGDGTPAHPHHWNRDNFAFLPFQLNTQEYLIPYYVVTLDVTRTWNEDKDIFDPTRYDMPEQDFDVTIGNVFGKGAQVEAYDPLSNSVVPVKIVASSNGTLTLRLKAVDYPRILRIKELQPGPQILDPQLKIDPDGKISINWKSNVPVSATVSYGRGWTNRSANEIKLTGRATSFNTQIPHDGKSGIIAVRISVSADGRNDVWPRWDEDPRGQLVINGDDEAVVVDPTVKPPDSPFDVTKIARAVAEPMNMPAGIVYPEIDKNTVYKFSLPLPKGLQLSGPANDRQGSLGGINYRVRYLPNAVAIGEDYLPMVSPIDEMDRSVVMLANDRLALHLAYHLNEAAHPGMSNLEQRFLLTGFGKDLLLISATGSLDAMKKQMAVITGVMAGLRLAE